MAYHLAEEARAGLSEFAIPKEFRDVLLDFQGAAVRIAARHLEKRGGVVIGDVVGLGKTLMASTLARVFQDPPHSLETLIICPVNLKTMWEDYAATYRLLCKIVPLTQDHGSCECGGRFREILLPFFERGEIVTDILRAGEIREYVLAQVADKTL